MKEHTRKKSQLTSLAQIIDIKPKNTISFISTTSKIYGTIQINVKKQYLGRIKFQMKTSNKKGYKVSAVKGIIDTIPYIIKIYLIDTLSIEKNLQDSIKITLQYENQQNQIPKLSISQKFKVQIQRMNKLVNIYQSEESSMIPFTNDTTSRFTQSLNSSRAWNSMLKKSITPLKVRSVTPTLNPLVENSKQQEISKQQQFQNLLRQKQICSKTICLLKHNKRRLQETKQINKTIQAKNRLKIYSTMLVFLFSIVLGYLFNVWYYKEQERQKTFWDYLTF